MDAATAARFDRLEGDFSAVVRGLRQMLETQAVQSEMLAKLLEAASQKPSSDLAQAILNVAAALNRNTEATERVETMMADLPEKLAAALTEAS